MTSHSFLDGIKSKLSYLSQHNQNTLNNIAEIEKLLLQRPTPKQLLNTLRQWPHAQDFYIQNYSFWICICLAVVALICASTIHPYFTLLGIGFVVYAFIQRQSPKAYQGLIQRLEAFILADQYQLQFDRPTEFPDAPTVLNFPLFRLGNHNNEIRQCIYGSWTFDGKIQPFMLFNYHYINQVETRDSDGKKKVKYEHHDLWGILVHHMSLQGISISAHQKRNCRLGIAWNSPDIQFNQRYQLSGRNEMQLARFFSPSRILKLEQAMQDYQGDFYIHPDFPSLLWLFDQDILKKQSIHSPIQRIEDLVLHLEQLSMPQFEHLQQNLKPLLAEL